MKIKNHQKIIQYKMKTENTLDEFEESNESDSMLNIEEFQKHQNNAPKIKTVFHQNSINKMTKLKNQKFKQENEVNLMDFLRRDKSVEEIFSKINRLKSLQEKIKLFS